MTQVVSPTGTTVYGYDDENIRVSSQAGGLTTRLVVDSNRDYAQVLAESRNGTIGVSYVYGLDLLSQKRGGTESFYLVDGLGSTRGLTDAAGGLTDSYTYDAFGNLVGSTGSTSNSYLFAGEQLDAGTGDYYLRQRFYDAGTGRFTRRDTFEGNTFEPITLHKYLYGNGNPVTYVDPTGLFSIADHAAANSIRDILNNIQIDNGSRLINQASGEEVTPKSVGFDIAISSFVGMAVPGFLGKGAKKLAETWGEPDAKVLRENMKKTGLAVPKFPNAAHHIVPGTSNRPDAQAARSHLARLGMNSNDSANGVFLEFRQKGKPQIGSGAIHNDIHTDVYFAEVRRRVLGATTKEEASEVLREIAEELQKNTFPY